MGKIIFNENDNMSNTKVIIHPYDCQIRNTKIHFPIMATHTVNDRHNGATDFRRNGASKKG